MKTERRKVGDFGESIALKFLMKRGFAFKERNYLRPWGEIDLIVQKGNEHHFIEVKSAVIHETGEIGVFHETIRPEENIHPAKMQRMQKAIHTYCAEHRIDNDKIFIDAVIVRISADHKKAKVILIDNIVL